jgi:hypothetical protein
MATATPERCVVQLRNAIGITVDSKILPIGFIPKTICMGPSNFIACNERTVYSWQFSSVNLNVVAADKGSEGGGDNRESGPFIFRIVTFFYFISGFFVRF